ncbi:PhnE/PtxC family ABC transporter permease [Pseudomonas aeruginosa]|nr:ABC transporter permease subunit [Pseudomonas aeruginosa]
MSRTWRLLLWPLLVVAAVGASFAYLDMDTAGLFSGKGLGQMAAYASEFFPPDLSAPHLRAIGRGLLETLAMSAIGTLLAALLGRLFAEALENTPAQPAEALRLAGSGRLAAFAYGTLPGVWPQLVAYTLYRWENNIRMASVLGFVGAGGLGQMLYFSLSLFQQAQAATVILAMLVLVLGVDSLSAWARQRWVSQ